MRLFFVLAASMWLTMPVFAQSDTELELNSIQTETLQIAINEHDFDKLENYYNDLRDLPAKAASSSAKLTVFYSALQNLSANPFGPAVLSQWKVQYPTSPAPLLAHASIKILKGIGQNEYSLYSQKPVDASSISGPDLEIARQYLLEIKDIAARDPAWAILMAKIIVVGHRDESEMTILADEELKRHPTNFEFIAMATDYYLPKWQGNAVKLERWARNITKRLASYDATGVYLLIYSRAFTADYGLNVLQASQIEGKQLRQSIADLTSRHPTQDNVNVASLFSCMMGDRTLTFNLLKASDFKGQCYVSQDHEAFCVCKKWALEN